ncbi:MAG: DUF192 domain-containing protein [Gammaproteobacteria bacterium]|nr:DUF192 domain-containing protein [Gammaproteobacteria bacterium]
MKWLVLLSLAAATVTSAISACSPQTAPKSPAAHDLDAMFEVDELVVVANDGSRHTFDVYLAIDHEQQRRGLMFVRDLPERTGMLFVYDDAAVRSMWMKNTYISLDMVFAHADGTVSSVIHDTEPRSLRSLSAIEPVNFVLELNAGVARRLGIGPGSRLIWEPTPD